MHQTMCLLCTGTYMDSGGIPGPKPRVPSSVFDRTSAPPKKPCRAPCHRGSAADPAVIRQGPQNAGGRLHNYVMGQSRFLLTHLNHHDQQGTREHQQGTAEPSRKPEFIQYNRPSSTPLFVPFSPQSPLSHFVHSNLRSPSSPPPDPRSQISTLPIFISICCHGRHCDITT
jgi:hypothetical protein